MPWSEKPHDSSRGVVTRNITRMHWIQERGLLPIYLPEHGLKLQKLFTDAAQGYVKFTPVRLRLTAGGVPQACCPIHSNASLQQVIEQHLQQKGMRTERRDDLLLISAPAHPLSPSSLGEEQQWHSSTHVTTNESLDGLLRRMVKEARKGNWTDVLQSFSPLTAESDDTYMRLLHYFETFVGRHNDTARLILLREQAWLYPRTDHLLLYLTLPTRGELPLPEKSDLYLENDTCQWLREHGWRVSSSPYSSDDSRISLLLASPTHFTRTFEWLHADYSEGLHA